MAATSRASVHFGERLTEAGHRRRFLLLSGPGVAWLAIFFLLPLLFIGAIAFFSRGAYGDVRLPLTLDNFRRFAGFGTFGYDPMYLMILGRSAGLAALTTLLCVAGGLPMAFFIAGLPPRHRPAALTLVLIPFWTNLLIRTYAWQILLAPDHLPARLLQALRLVPPDRPLYPSLPAVGLGMLCDFLPFLVLPLYASVEKIDWSIAEAAMDLGANRLGVFRHALLPQIAPGLLAGIVLVFIPAMGQFVVPDLLGGAKTAMIGNVIQQQFGPSRDWPFGSAVAGLTMGLVMLGLWLYARTAGEHGEELV